MVINKLSNTPLFENKMSPLMPFRKFVKRLMSYFLFAILLIAISLWLGTWGYHYFGHLAWIDSFYNASLILAGMGPVDVLKTDAAKLFASFYALFSGIAFLSTAAIIFTPIAHRLLHVFHLKDYK